MLWNALVFCNGLCCAVVLYCVLEDVGGRKWVIWTPVVLFCYGLCCAVVLFCVLCVLEDDGGRKWVLWNAVHREIWP